MWKIIKKSPLSIKLLLLLLMVVFFIALLCGLLFLIFTGTAIGPIVSPILFIIGFLFLCFKKFKVGIFFWVIAIGLVFGFYALHDGKLPWAWTGNS